ncbi:MAG TPA: aminotransferase class IV, partial [Thermoanaerobaculia bacterium]|nr:aminotransferase class IV [Thermoanaerobaculia bacterium]
MKKKTILPRFAHFDGAVVPYEKAKVSVLTHALNYGTAVFGGLRAFWNPEEEQLFVFRPEDHFTRFLESTRLLNMDLPETPASLTKSLKSLLTAEALKEDAYIRPLAFYADEGIGVKLHGLTPAVSMVAIPFDHYVANEEGLHVTVSSWRRVDDNTIPPRGKIAGAYVNSAFAKTDALRAGFDEAIVLNRQGHVSEGTAANFFIVRNGRVATPPTS